MTRIRRILTRLEANMRRQRRGKVHGRVQLGQVRTGTGQRLLKQKYAVGIEAPQADSSSVPISKVSAIRSQLLEVEKQCEVT